MKQIAIYARVSTSDKWQDLNTQLIPLREYVKARGWRIFDEYCDEISWVKESRPKLDQMLSDAYKRKFSAILVFRFDRFARSTKQLINSLETFKSLWIDFISYQENIDTTTPAWKMMFTIISAFAEFERWIISERVIAWLNKLKSRWIKLWRPSVQVSKDEVLNLKNKGLGYREMWKILWISPAKISQILKEK